MAPKQINQMKQRKLFIQSRIMKLVLGVMENNEQKSCHTGAAIEKEEVSFFPLPLIFLSDPSLK